MFAAFIDLLILGGPVVWLLALFSLAATAIGLFKTLQLWQFRAACNTCITQALAHLAQGSRAQALLLLGDKHKPRAQLMAKSIHLFDSPRLSVDDIKAEAMRLARLLLGQLSSHLRALEVIANLAPLLGLFGTVLGMIGAFQAMEAAGEQVNPAVLSGGIWMALLTTAVGLAVAIPASLLHNWLERRVELQAQALQDDLEHLFTIEAELMAAAGHSAKFTPPAPSHSQDSRTQLRPEIA
jgi:biopolymer transport protein ExbB